MLNSLPGKRFVSKSKHREKFCPLPVGIIYAAATINLEGQIPPPDQLKQFEEALPRSDERIFQMAEREQNHRQD